MHHDVLWLSPGARTKNQLSEPNNFNSISTIQEVFMLISRILENQSCSIKKISCSHLTGKQLFHGKMGDRRRGIPPSGGSIKYQIYVSPQFGRKTPFPIKKMEVLKCNLSTSWEGVKV